MKTIKYLFIGAIVLFSFNKMYSQKNNLTLAEYSNIKINNVSLENINNTNGDISLMQGLFGNTLQVEKGYDEAIEYWIKFSTNSFCIEFYNGINTSSVIKYDLANIELENNSSNFTIKGKVVTIGNNASLFVNENIRNHQNKKVMIFEPQGYDSYIYIDIDNTSNLITKIGYNGNLL